MNANESATLGDQETAFENYPWTTPLLENLVWFAIYAVGFVVFWLFRPWAGVAYAAYALGCMYVLIPRFVCTHCVYYGRTCHSGQSRIATLLFQQREADRFDGCFKTMRWAAPVFLAPVLGGLVLIGIHFTWVRLGLTLAAMMLVFVCARMVTMKLGCPHCRQRTACPAHRKGRE